MSYEKFRVCFLKISESLKDVTENPMIVIMFIFYTSQKLSNFDVESMEKIVKELGLGIDFPKNTIDFAHLRKDFFENLGNIPRNQEISQIIENSCHY
ncbi:MAG: hypothetical protein ABFQ53_01795 [Patescibacteria group bacterium]